MTKESYFDCNVEGDAVECSLDCENREVVGRH